MSMSIQYEGVIGPFSKHELHEGLIFLGAVSQAEPAMEKYRRSIMPRIASQSVGKN